MWLDAVQSCGVCCWQHVTAENVISSKSSFHFLEMISPDPKYSYSAGKEVIISRRAAEAVLRGADVFVPG